MLPRNDDGWSNPRVLLVLAVMFLCGAAFGSAVTRSYLHSRMELDHRTAQPIDEARRVGLERLRTQLDLTPEQIKAVTKELDDYAKYYQNIEDEREDVAEHGRQRILDVLTEDQKRRFNAIFGGSAH